MTYSTTELSIRWLKNNDYVSQNVEQYNQFAFKRKDLFGFIDIVAIKPGIILAVQTTTRANMRSRWRKIDSLAESRTWLAAGGRIVVHGWYKDGQRWRLAELVYDGITTL